MSLYVNWDTTWNILKTNLSYCTYACILTYILGDRAQKFMSMLFLLILLCVLYIGYNIIKNYICQKI